MNDHASDMVAAAIGKNMAVGGGSAALVFGLAASDLCAIGGLLIAAIGLGIQYYYKRRTDRREASLYAAQIDEIKRRG